MLRRTFPFALIGLMLIALVLTGCNATAASKSERPPLKVAVNVWPGDYPMAIAQQQGFFAKHGVEVEIVYSADYPQAITDYASGKVDAMNIALGDLMPLISRRDSKVVLIADSSEGIDQIIATDEIQSAADLKGKRIGVKLGSYAEVFVREFLRANNIAVTDVTFVDTVVESAADFFPSQVDAMHTYEPYTSEVLKSGGHVLATSADTRPLLLPAVIAFSADVAVERPEDVRAFVAAYFEAVDWMYAHETEAPAVVAQALGLTPEDIFLDDGDRVLTLAENRTALAPGTGEIYLIANEYIEFLTETGRLTFAPNLEELIDSSFLQ